MKSQGRVILEQERFDLTINRLCHQLIESYDDFSNTCLIGVQPRGIFLADRIHKQLKKILSVRNLEYGKLDITFYRDDFRIRAKPLTATVTDINFLVDDKKVILVDDVLYSGRTIQAAMTGLNHYGRPSDVELLVLVDRRFNRQLPIQANYIGLTVDALDEAYVQVEWEATDGADRILLFQDKKHKKKRSK